MPKDKVAHPQYGVGTVLALDGMGLDTKARISFVAGIERTFIVAKSPLRPIADDGGSVSP
jgi:DNA helicase-2/ATP-dependent DNA helicase PcrA